MGDGQTFDARAAYTQLRQRFDGFERDLDASLNQRLGPVEKDHIELRRALRDLTDEFGACRQEIVNLRGFVNTRVDGVLARVDELGGAILDALRKKR